MKLSEVLRNAKPYVWDGTPEQWKVHGCRVRTYICNAIDSLFVDHKNLWIENGEAEEDAAHDVRQALKLVNGKLHFHGSWYSTFGNWRKAQGATYPTPFAEQQARLQWLDELIAECEEKERNNETK